ncbi:hypothetical protein CsSME_00013809 [Camellia sinensis var. sinensis]
MSIHAMLLLLWVLVACSLSRQTTCILSYRS